MNRAPPILHSSLNQRPNAESDHQQLVVATTEQGDSGQPEQPSAQPHASSENAKALIGAVPKIIPFRDLARCGDEIWIENEGQIYRLRRTKQGKLILTK